MFLGSIIEYNSKPFCAAKNGTHACNWSREIRMGFAPTLLKLSNGEQNIANGELNFIDINQVDATQTNVGKLPKSMNKLSSV